MRKSTIYALLALFVWTMAVPATAQKKQQRSMKNLDPEATVEAVKQVIRKHQGLGRKKGKIPHGVTRCSGSFTSLPASCPRTNSSISWMRQRR